MDIAGFLFSGISGGFVQKAQVAYDRGEGVRIMGKIGDRIIFSGCLLLHELFMAQHGGFVCTSCVEMPAYSGEDIVYILFLRHIAADHSACFLQGGADLLAA